MSPQVLIMTLLLILAAFYLPVLVSVLRRHEGQEAAAALLGAYAVVAMLMGIGEALLRGGRLQVEQLVASDVQLYGALLLAVIILLAVLEFARRREQLIRVYLNAAGKLQQFWPVPPALMVPFQLTRLGAGSATRVPPSATAWSAPASAVTVAGGADAVFTVTVTASFEVQPFLFTVIS